MRGRPTLREYLEQKIEAVANLHRGWERQLEAAQSAAAEERERIRDALAGAATRVEVAAVADKVDLLQSEVDRINGRRTLMSGIGAVAGGGLCSLIVGIAVYLVSHH